MNKKWQDRLTQLLKENNAVHNTAAALREAQEKKSEGAKNPTAKTAKTPNGDVKSVVDGSKKSQGAENLTAKTAETTEAEHLGVVATWSIEFGYISIYDPSSGEWHDLPTKEAPEWAVGEARRRRKLYKGGNRKAYRLTSREMEEVWEAEYVPELEGIIEDHPIEEEDELGTG